MTGRTPPADGAGCAGQVSSAHEPAYLSLVLHLPYQSPWEWRQFHQHFALRLLAGVESLGDDHYARSFRANGRPAWFEVRPLAERQVLALSLSPSAHALAAELEARVRRMFDLDSDPAAIARHFAGDPCSARWWPPIRDCACRWPSIPSNRRCAPSSASRSR